MRTFILSLLLLCSTRVDARSLYWSSIHVDAQLDAQGVLTVAETQTFVFDGDWNGGERRFDIRDWQSFELLGVERIEGDVIVPLSPGEKLARVDEYAIMESEIVRWRSRLPSDPPFENRSLTYRIRYRLHGILLGRDRAYLLDHDFLFPDRSGDVKDFSLRLTSDAAWSGIEPVFTATASNLRPSEGFLVKKNLTWRGPGVPDAATERPSPRQGQAVAALFVAGIIGLSFAFYRRERSRGRFAPLTPAEEIDEGWLEEHVFAFLPETVGTAVDGKTGAGEVAASIATMVQRKQLESSFEKRTLRRPVLKLRLLVDRDTIDGHYHALVGKLFWGGRKTTDTSALREHYSSTGLDLAAIVRGAAESQLRRVHGWQSTTKTDWKYPVTIFVLSIVILIATAIRGGTATMVTFGSLLFGLVGAIAAAAAARHHSNALTRFPLRAAMVFVPLVPLVLVTLLYTLDASEYVLRLPPLLAGVAFTLALFNLVFACLRSDESPDRIAFRKRLISARRYLKGQLRSREPKLRDEWFPYLLAFGLGRNVDSWFQSYGAAGERIPSVSRGSSHSFGSSSSSSGSIASWSGGGGGFGGAGASGSWAVAAAVVGAGVSAPSSSGSGGGGGGSSSSGGSSGGGGGGGW
jgi:uncharacterized membrane protein YgcG